MTTAFRGRDEICAADEDVVVDSVALVEDVGEEVPDAETADVFEAAGKRGDSDADGLDVPVSLDVSSMLVALLTFREVSDFQDKFQYLRT